MKQKQCINSEPYLLINLMAPRRKITEAPSINPGQA
jgi:hypothetical protein